MGSALGGGGGCFLWWEPASIHPPIRPSEEEGEEERGARSLSGALRQRVAHVLVALGEQLLLLVRAGQRVVAVVGSHVQGGVHRVGEVGGLRRRGEEEEGLIRSLEATGSSSLFLMRTYRR